MKAESPTKIISAVMGLTAFALAALAGWSVHNPLPTILTRAIIAMVACFAVGQVLGWAVTKLAREHMDTYRKRHPIPTTSSSKAAPPDAQDPRIPHSQSPETPQTEVARAAA